MRTQAGTRLQRCGSALWRSRPALPSLSRLSGPNGIIRQTEFFTYSDRDKAAIWACQDLGLKFPEITTWIRARKEDFRIVKEMGVRETGILTSCSDYHIFYKLGMSRPQAMKHYLSIIHDAFEAGIVPRCHLEDITRADFYGFVVPFVREIQEMSRQAGMPPVFTIRPMGMKEVLISVNRLQVEARMPFQFSRS